MCQKVDVFILILNHCSPGGAEGITPAMDHSMGSDTGYYIYIDSRRAAGGPGRVSAFFFSFSLPIS